MQNRVILVNLDKIKEIAGEQGYNVHSLEKKAGLKNGTVRKWNKAVPNLRSLFGVAEVLGIDYWKLTEIK